MQVIHDINDIPKFQDTVLTIGTYDGVHFGHQQILRRVIETAKTLGSKSILMTFHPHPRLVLQPNHPVKLITTFEEKMEILADYDLDYVVAIPFSTEFAAMDADAYIKDIIVNLFHPKKIIIGYDHKFGKNRLGDLNLLERFSATYGYEVEEISKQTIDEIAVSSTKVRAALLEGDIQSANFWLAHPFTLSGKVVDGDKIGRTLGFPTANISIENPNKLIPPSGVYAVKVMLDGQSYNGALSIGNRPTFNLGNQLVIEVFIIDFSADIYGKQIKITFLEKVRGQRRFENQDELIAQMEKDVQTCKRICEN
ncbi:MAG: bifunctional riboflavin kinase/FAD synthetase [Chitinophagales bacterium]|nr:bifunctional riboflavin kinase/FAD synthetase [Chitinophagales bacterium]